MERFKKALVWFIGIWTMENFKKALVWFIGIWTMENFKKALQWLFDIAMYANIVALFPQPISMLLKKTAEGVSIWTWVIFFIFQLAISLHGKLNIQSRSMFYGMAGSALVSLATVILCLIY